MPMLTSAGGATRRARRARRGQPGPEPVPSGRRRWRCPAVLRVKSAVLAAAGAAIALVFFPAWFAIPVAVLFAAWGLGLAVRAATVDLDPGAGLLVLRVGLITRRVTLADITAVLVDEAKVSIARSGGGEISLYAWRKSRLDGWLRVPAVAADIGHAVASAVALARDAVRDASPAADQSPAASQPAGVTTARTRSALATALLGGVGLVALAAAFLVRLSWPNPVLTAASVLLALALGVAGLFYLLCTCWLLLARGHSARGPAGPTA